MIKIACCSKIGIKYIYQYKSTYMQFQIWSFSESNIDGLELTKLWLSRSFEKLRPDGESAAGGATEPNQATPAAILNGAYMEILQWDDSHIFPEVETGLFGVTFLNTVFVNEIMLTKSLSLKFNCQVLKCGH